MWNSRRLVLAHLWLAFAGFGVALLLGEWQMFVRSPLHAWISDPEWYYRSVTAHGTTMAYVFPTLVAMGFGYFVTEAALQASHDRPALGLARIRACRHRHGHGDRPGRPGACLGALHLLPAADRQSFLLHRGCPRRRRLVDLGRADVGESVPLEAGQSRRAGAVRDVRHGRRLLSLGLDRGRRGARTAVPDHPRGARTAQTRSTPGWRASSSPGHCTRSSISG